MLPRVLEPEAMNTPDEAVEYDSMDHAAVNARFVADFLAGHGPCRGGEILDLGTGTARIPIALCQADPNARVLATDLSGPMLDLAHRNIAAAELAARIRTFHGDAKELTLPNGAFEAVISNSITHHIPDPAPVVCEIVRLVAPGGTVFVRDLARPSDLDQIDQLLQTYAGSESAPARALFEASLRAALTLDEFRALVRGVGLVDAGACVTQTSDRHWTWLWRRPD
ncbi:MAG: class I SAM-dependent methyltransferase [Isosphaeraceae bacterium]|nr:class I SAM-dependent methyltransferase [Isosphaeraceae bacterium]